MANRLSYDKHALTSTSMLILLKALPVVAVDFEGGRRYIGNGR